ncbi:hypothetical protein ACHHYP_08775 [Achlya hypogyna]|uniref:Uncharacterized protein n=1 Tax=Achlya hypogyna TaxID=1202772 RepID=A0A1V9ZJZ2_ACHHY|nr:hypothetical protein ACHHYP_08775 [Achlya hypogyna]
MEDAKERRRVYQRHKQRQYRSRESAEVASLKTLVAELELTVARLTDELPTPLPWADVAAALRDEATLTTHKNKALKAQLNEYQELVVVMTTWVTKHIPIQKSLPAAAYSWRNATLFANREARKLGFDWITKHLFHNTERMLHDKGFPALGTRDDFAIDMSDPDFFEYTWRHQVAMAVPFEVAVGAFRQFMAHFVSGGVWSQGMCTHLDNDLLQEVSPALSYTRIASSARESINFLSREFDGPQQCVFVCQNIPHDERLPPSEEQCNRRLWIVLDRVGPNETRVRVLYVNSHGFDAAGPFDLAREAAYWNYDGELPTGPARLQAFAAHVHSVGRAFIAYNTGQMRRIFAQERYLL